jgi:hypothetical protein
MKYLALLAVAGAVTMPSLMAQEWFGPVHVAPIKLEI